MRAVIQRVSEGKVAISGQIKGAIARGLVVLVAVEDADTAEDVEWLSGKIARLRIFGDAEGVMNLSVQEIGGEILVVSQFTLFASTKSCLTTMPSEFPEKPVFMGQLQTMAPKLGLPCSKPQWHLQTFE